jgi:pimeloyl-ACP methyl ester carboxylesterase
MKPVFICLVAAGILLMTFPESQSSAQENDSAEISTGQFNWKMKTMGGSQFWTDHRVVGNWRVQQNSETQHYRLLDANNVRHAWGSFEDCNRFFDSKIADGTVSPYRGPIVILLHGLIRSSKSMSTLQQHLASEGFQTVNFQYASSRKKVEQHADALKLVIDGLGPEVTEIYFVCHSLGNIVVRHYLADNTDPISAKQGDPRIRRMVMIGPPNQGSRIARLLKKNVAFKLVAGASGSELAEGWEQLEPNLATPSFEFGIIAGGPASDSRFGNFMLAGRDDYTVSVEETKLVGARDFLVEPLIHSTMMKQPVTLESTVRFFKQGHFRADDSRFPLK